MDQGGVLGEGWTREVCWGRDGPGKCVGGGMDQGSVLGEGWTRGVISKLIIINNKNVSIQFKDC